MDVRSTSRRLLLWTLAFLGAPAGCGYGPFDNKGYLAPDVIRMAQPDEGDLEKLLEKDKIRSIVNLRGENAGKDWYDTELAFAQRNAIEFHSIRLSTGRLPTREQLGDLIQTFKNAPHPLVMHCQGGADRTGFAAVVYRLVIFKDPLDKALGGFSVWHGHLERNTPLDKLFDAYREEAGGRGFEEWFQQDYDVERLKKKLELPP